MTVSMVLSPARLRHFKALAAASLLYLVTTILFQQRFRVFARGIALAAEHPRQFGHALSGSLSPFEGRGSG
jgi:hypothetical protein